MLLRDWEFLDGWDIERDILFLEDSREDVFDIISDSFFWETLCKNGYNKLTSEQKNVLLWLLKMQKKSREQLLKIFESQKKLGIPQSLPYIMDIIISSKFAYGIADLCYLTWQTHALHGNVSLKFFSEQKIYEIGWMNFISNNWSYHKKYFFQTLVEVRDIIGASNIDIHQFFKFYSTYITPKDHLRFFARKNCKHLFQNIAYLFTIWEKSHVWKTVLDIIAIDPWFDFSTQTVQSISELEEKIFESVCMSNMGIDVSWLLPDLKVTLTRQMSRYRTPNSFTTELQSFLGQWMDIVDIAIFLDITRYSLGELHTMLFTNKWWPANNPILQRFWTLRWFFDWVKSQKLDARKFGTYYLESIILNDGFEDLNILKQLHFIPSKYYLIKQLRPDFQLKYIPADILRDAHKIIPILTLLYDVLLYDLSFDFTQKSLSEKSLLIDIAAIKRHTIYRYRLASLWLQKDLCKKLPINFLVWYSPEQFSYYFAQCATLWYDLNELVKFSWETGYTFSDICQIIFFPLIYKDAWYFSKDIVSPKYIDLPYLSQVWVTRTNTSTQSIGYYVYAGFPYHVIPYLDTNINIFLWWENGTAVYREVSYDIQNSSATILKEILRLQPNFDIGDLVRYFPEKSFPKHISSSFLENILLLMRVYPRIDITKIDPKLLQFSDRFQNQFLYWEKEGQPTSPQQTLFGALLKNPDISDTHNYNIKILEQFTFTEGLWKFFTTPPRFDISRDKMHIMKAKRVSVGSASYTAREYIRIQTTKQFEVLTNILRNIDLFLMVEPDCTFMELLDAVMPPQEELTFSQRYDVIVRIKHYLWLQKEVARYIKKYKNPVDLLDVIAPTDFNPQKIKGKVEVVQEGTNCIFYFSSTQDFIEASWGWKDTERAGWFKFNSSKIPSLSGTISFVRWPKGTVNSFTSSIKIHEAQHVKNGFIFWNVPGTSLETPPIDRAKDEIIAYMSDGSEYMRIIDVLTDENGLYNYHRHLMYSDYKLYLKNWRKHTEKVKRFVGIAFFVKKLYPTQYLDMLAVTDVHNWESLLEGSIMGYHTYKKIDMRLEDIDFISQYFFSADDLGKNIYYALQGIIKKIQTNKMHMSSQDRISYATQLGALFQTILDYPENIFPSKGRSWKMWPKERLAVFLLVLIEHYSSQKDEWDDIL